MKKHSLIFVTATLLTAGISLVTTQVPASAHFRAVKVPASLRGTWYHYDGTYNKIRATKYHFKTSGSNGSSSFSGVKFPKYASGHADMFVHRTPKGYYNIGKYGTDDVGTFKKITHKGHTAIKQVWHDLPDTGAHVTYWYHTKSIAKHPSGSHKKSSTETVYDLGYKNAPKSLKQCVGKTVYTSEITDKDSPVTLYKTSNIYDDDTPTGGNITMPGVSVTLKSLTRDDDDISTVAEIEYQGQSYYVDGDGNLGDIVPYNTFVYSGSVQSSCKPTDKSSVLVKYNQYVSTKDNLWDYANPRTGDESYYSYSSKKDLWYYDKNLN
ncbi:hypothetical protein [Levilactobacillus spicheri]|uniref:Uncharacterized protein n=1 Tax=Levilactobacillus spicheri TaxID=216463 RepID=A0A0F3RRJ3_9LACO|nr:hypothetical protein [Levilactobacillus spicheri]KJW12224.1 hypothetical protein VC81_10040 [Levilactobacillus spicheri]